MSTPPQSLPQVPPQKQRRGLTRMWFALGYALSGLRAAWSETAFRQEAMAAVVLLPLGIWLAHGWVEGALLAGSVLLVLIVELLNTALESAVDRVGPEWHAMSKRAKDAGAAAVLLALLLAGGIWAAALYQRIFS